ncbi:ABC transporter substrate-binding protein [Cohnella fermenti]|uniref:ABC transporter substrate-binding protein n=1 Tax=Cohnella fermenti TaxID=2565925 RepID=A0A4S4BPR0_9BACL|nr:ABC transporter substrate-binding protein [Cohnella fermenti]THF76746.1 ABC transporter substrate-binding protein [Cohnella fermenti]
MKRATLAVILILTGLLLLAACGNAELSSSQSPTNASTNNEQADPSPSASVEPASTDAAGEESATRMVTDMYGEIEVPVAPKRMLVTNTRYAEYLIEMGITPAFVLYVAESEPDFRSEYFTEHGVEMIEYPQYEQNFELLASLDTDLIVVSGNGTDEATYEQLSKIAPTIAVPGSFFMEDGMPALAQVFDVESEYEQAIASYDQYVQEAVAKLSPYTTGKTVMVLRVEPKQYRFLGMNSAGASQLFYRQLGFVIPEALEGGESWFNPFSLEILPEINPDYIFIEKRVAEGSDSDESWNDLMNNVLWKNLDAVKHNRVFPVETRDLVQGEGPIGFRHLIDQIVTDITSAE